MEMSRFATEEGNVHATLAAQWRGEIANKLSETRQRHILDAFDALTSHKDKEALYMAVSDGLHDVRHLERIYFTSMAAFTKAQEGGATTDGQGTGGIAPPAADDCATEFSKSLYDAGLQLVAKGVCAVVVLAGGSGTRLGCDKPKGMFVCPGLRTQMSLYEMHAAKLLKVQQLAATGSAPAPIIPLVLMTSEQTDRETRDFFDANDNFGLAKDQIYVFKQESIPCFDRDGRIILSSPTTIATAPSGNAGIYSAIDSSGVLNALERRHGTRYLQIVTVDNMTCRIADPVMYGYAAQENADVVVKATPKAYDEEKVGVFARKKGKEWGVVEYTELGERLAKLKDPKTGERVYNCGNLGIHLFTMDFMHAAAEAMKTFDYYHVALKPIPVAAAAKGQASSVPGVKLEGFIFDLFYLAKTFRIMQVDRLAEFSPVKNADKTITLPDGATELQKDSPATSVRDLHALHKQWATEFLRSVAGRGTEEERKKGSELLQELRCATIEIPPTVSYGGEGLSLTIVEALLKKETARL